uniref:At2g35280-like TPR domain-containing protein n=1 Tax=Leersia perrieri TaxID=77586 RepID=A0A0D9UWM5_9ORYZ
MVTTRSMAAKENQMKRKRSPAKAKQMKKKRSPTSSAAAKELALCHDNVVHIAGIVAATSPEPIADLLNLRATCKAMHAATKERDVGRRVPLERLEGMKWGENGRYIAIVNNLAVTGNPDACFHIGVALIFTRQDIVQGILYLTTAAAGGHKTAAYVLGILLYSKSDKLTTLGKKYISQVEGDDGEEETAAVKMRTNRECCRCRKIAEDAVREVTWKVAGGGRRRGRILAMPVEGQPCTNAGCGVDSGWEGYGVFCSDGCRIRHEYSEFFTEVMNYMP